MVVCSSLAALPRWRGPQAGLKSPRPVRWAKPTKNPLGLRAKAGLYDFALAEFVMRPQAVDQIGATSFDNQTAAQVKQKASVRINQR